MMPLDVICPQCNRCHYQTNDHGGWINQKEKGHIAKSIPDPRIRQYNPDTIANGAMITMKEPWATELNWSGITPSADVIGDNLICPECDGVLVGPDGKFIKTVQQKQVRKKRNG